MADIPALKPRCLDLDMALQCEAMPLPGEGLVQIARRRGEEPGAFGQVEGIAMPMQHRRVVAQRRQARGAPRIGELKRRPADLFAPAGIDARTERPRHELAAEADAEHRPAGGEALL